MRAEQKEPVVQSLAVQEAPWTDELHVDDIGADSGIYTYKILTACSATAVLNITATQFGKESENRSCWAAYSVSQTNPCVIFFLAKFQFLTQKTQMCDGWELQEHVRLPLFIKQQNLCEICLLMVAILTCLHWSCMFSVFGQHRWKQRFLPGVIVATFITLLPLATLVRDPTICDYIGSYS